jgi:hypothetical protein
MLPREIRRASDANGNHKTPSDRPDLLRLRCKGKDLASSDKSKSNNGRAIGEDGKPVQRTINVTDNPSASLLGGDRSDQASMSNYVSPQTLANMSTEEKINWFLEGGLAKALGPNGDRAFVPVIFNILEGGQINMYVCRDAVDALGTILVAHHDKDMNQKIVNIMDNVGIDSYIRGGAAEALGTILAKHPDKDMTQKIVNILDNDKIKFLYM